MLGTDGIIKCVYTEARGYHHLHDHPFVVHSATDNPEVFPYQHSVPHGIRQLF